VIAAGAFGAFRYIDNFRLYRGYPPPKEPAYVHARGHVDVLHVRSAALGGRSQRVLVYLPPGYTGLGDHRFPVLYLLHGSPGSPEPFLTIVRAGIVEDSLLARHRARPMIVVMPFGSSGTFTDKEWVDGVRPHEGWETFVARDLVREIDTRYATFADGAGRAIGGLSEGGYGAINLAVHHPGEFRVVESWSGYERASPNSRLFGRDSQRLRYNSPLDQLAAAAPRLRAAHTYFWFYSGSGDPLRNQNRLFALALGRAYISHHFFIVHGRHDWRLWRDNADAAILAAERALRRR
jgi:enterochelin esterase-like enzyme